jgi:hypothetical protein
VSPFDVVLPAPREAVGPMSQANIALGVACAIDTIYLAVSNDGVLLEDPHERLGRASILEENEALQALLEDFGRVLTEVAPAEVRIMRPEQTYKDSYARIAPRAALETIARLSCAERATPVEMLNRASARSRLGLPRGGNFATHLGKTVSPVGRYWNKGRNLAAAAALAGE